MIKIRKMYRRPFFVDYLYWNPSSSILSFGDTISFLVVVSFVLKN